MQYTTNSGATWIDIPDATIFNGRRHRAANGIRFVYTADPAGGGCSGGFPPGTSVSPNLSFALDEAAPNDQLDPLTNCAASSATTPTAPDANAGPACDELNFTPVDTGPGGIDPIDKAWDQNSVIERSQSQVGVDPVVVDARLHRHTAHRHHRHREPRHHPHRRQRV